MQLLDEQDYGNMGDCVSIRGTEPRTGCGFYLDFVCNDPTEVGRDVFMGIVKDWG